jgi:hypothetical protein
MSKPQVKYGFLIEDGKIYDTKIESFELKKEVIGSNIIYYLKSKYYKRLYFFEPLLCFYSVEKVFKILNYNSYLKKERKNDVLNHRLHYMSNMALIYNYPPKYLTKRAFGLYKICQSLKKKLD